MAGAGTSCELYGGSTVSDLSNDSSVDQGYLDFPPSPDSWLGDNGNNNTTTSTTNSSIPTGLQYWYSNILFKYIQKNTKKCITINTFANIKIYVIRV